MQFGWVLCSEVIIMAVFDTKSKKKKNLFSLPLQESKEMQNKIKFMPLRNWEYSYTGNFCPFGTQTYKVQNILS